MARRQHLTEAQVAELFDPPTEQRDLVRAHSGDPERSNRLIMNTHSGDHEHRLADA